MKSIKSIMEDEPKDLERSNEATFKYAWKQAEQAYDLIVSLMNYKLSIEDQRQENEQQQQLEQLGVCSIISWNLLTVISL